MNESGFCEYGECCEPASIYYHIECNEKFGKFCTAHWQISHNPIQAGVYGIKEITQEEYNSLLIIHE